MPGEVYVHPPGEVYGIMSLYAVILVVLKFTAVDEGSSIVKFLNIACAVDLRNSALAGGVQKRQIQQGERSGSTEKHWKKKRESRILDLALT